MKSGSAFRFYLGYDFFMGRILGGLFSKVFKGAHFQLENNQKPNKKCPI
jgi:hypothetical protein